MKNHGYHFSPGLIKLSVNLLNFIEIVVQQKAGNFCVFAFHPQKWMRKFIGKYFAQHITNMLLACIAETKQQSHSLCYSNNLNLTIELNEIRYRSSGTVYTCVRALCYFCFPKY